MRSWRRLRTSTWIGSRKRKHGACSQTFTLGRCGLIQGAFVQIYSPEGAAARAQGSPQAVLRRFPYPSSSQCIDVPFLPRKPIRPPLDPGSAPLLLFSHTMKLIKPKHTSRQISARPQSAFHTMVPVRASAAGLPLSLTSWDCAAVVNRTRALVRGALRTHQIQEHQPPTMRCAPACCVCRRVAGRMQRERADSVRSTTQTSTCTQRKS